MGRAGPRHIFPPPPCWAPPACLLWVGRIPSVPCSNLAPAASEENRADQRVPSFFPHLLALSWVSRDPRRAPLVTRKLRDACWGDAALSFPSPALAHWPNASAALASPCSALCHSQPSKMSCRIWERSTASQAEQESPQVSLLGGRAVTWLLLTCFRLKFFPQTFTERYCVSSRVWGTNHGQRPVTSPRDSESSGANEPRNLLQLRKFRPTSLQLQTLEPLGLDISMSL